MGNTLSTMRFTAPTMGKGWWAAWMDGFVVNWVIDAVYAENAEWCSWGVNYKSQRDLYGAERVLRQMYSRWTLEDWVAKMIWDGGGEGRFLDVEAETRELDRMMEEHWDGIRRC